LAIALLQLPRGSVDLTPSRRRLPVVGLVPGGITERTVTRSMVGLLIDSGVTRVKRQPGQLTNKQLSRRSAKRSWVGGGAAYRNPP